MPARRDPEASLPYDPDHDDPYRNGQFPGAGDGEDDEEEDEGRPAGSPAARRRITADQTGSKTPLPA